MDPIPQYLERGFKLENYKGMNTLGALTTIINEQTMVHKGDD